MVTREKSEKGFLKLKIEISGKKWAEAIERSYEKNKGKYNIQGFRKGKAPKKVIEQNYGDTVFYDDAFDDVVSEEYSEFLKNNPEYEIADYPKVNIDSMTADGLKVSLTVALMPEVELGPIAFNVKKNKPTVSEKEIEFEMKRFLESQARFVETDLPAQVGDFVTIDFSGSVNGEKFEGGTAQDYRLELGSHTFIEGFEEQVVGLKTGDEKIAKVTFPEKYPAENLAGKPADFQIVVKKVEKKEIPELTDKLVSFATEFANVEDYKKDLKAKILKTKTSQAEREFENSLIEEAVKKAKVDLPQSMIEHEKEHMIKDLENRLAYQQIKLQDYLAYIGKTNEEFDKEQIVEAEKALKTRLVLQKIVKENNIGITHEEIHAKIHEIADVQGKSCEEVEKSLGEYDLSYIQNDILMNKLIAFLKSKNS